ncbi:Small ubiquitin-related modifier 2 [Linum perenne]
MKRAKNEDKKPIIKHPRRSNYQRPSPTIRKSTPRYTYCTGRSGGWLNFPDEFSDEFSDEVSDEVSDDEVFTNQVAAEENKPAVVEGPPINIKVLAQDGTEVCFRIRRRAQLQMLMEAYSKRQSVELRSIAFLYDGRRLRANQTPDEVGMEDGDEIDAMLHQSGGATVRSSA